jgi:hypothetical protein
MFKEYPKCLIQGEASTVVFDATEEESARSRGFKFHDEIELEAPDLSHAPDDNPKQEESPAPERKKPGRKPKAE